MPLPSKLTSNAWLAFLALAVGWLLWTNASRIERIEFVSGLAGGSEVAADDASPTGYADGLRVLIAPANNAESYQWILQTQQMLAEGTWRVRHVDYDNAPEGREVFSPSPFRWWLALAAWLDTLFSDHSLARAVEAAALYAGPLLHLVLLIATAFSVATRFGTFAAAASVIVLSGAFPLAASFLPGQPEARIMVMACSLWSVLPVLGNSLQVKGKNCPAEERSRSERRAFLFAGSVGGLGLWVAVSGQVPVLIGIALGGAMAAWFCRKPQAGTDQAYFALPSDAWRWWSYGGAAVSLAAYMIEYAPGYLWSLRLTENHPVYALAWLGGGELLARAGQRASFAGQAKWSREDIVVMSLATCAVLLVPAIMIATSSRGFLPADVQLTSLPGSPIADSFFGWLARDGFNRLMVATLLPALLLVPAGWLLIRRHAPRAQQHALLLALGPAGIALGFAMFQLRWWNHFDILLVGVIAATAVNAASESRILSWARLAAAVFLVLPGTKVVLPETATGTDRSVSPFEVESLVERDLAHWLARQVGPAGANVLAPPKLTTSLIFHGGLKGLGTPYRENEDGFAAAVRISAATSADEGQALANSRKVTHVMMPSWDPFLEEYARLGANEAESTMVAMLKRWLPPRWLRPVPYQLPDVAGFEDDYVAIFQTVDMQDNATALSRLAEYFIEMNQLEGASSVSEALERSFPADLSALVARAHVAMAKRDEDAFNTIVESTMPYLDSGMTGALPWDRRVSLAVVLAQARHMINARDQLQLCLDEADEDLLRSLSSVSLYRLLALADSLGSAFLEPQLEETARNLLSAEMRAAL